MLTLTATYYSILLYKKKPLGLDNKAIFEQIFNIKNLLTLVGYYSVGLQIYIWHLVVLNNKPVKRVLYLEYWLILAWI